MSYPDLLAVAVENRICSGQLAMTTRTRVVIRAPIIIGTGSVDGIVLSDMGYWRDISAIANASNAFTIVSAAIENNGVSSAPVYSGASRTWTINPGDHDIKKDVFLPSALGLSSFAVGAGLWLRMEISVPSTSMQLLISNRLTSQVAGTQCGLFDPGATTLVNGVDGVGAFTVSGTALSNQSFFYMPMVLGYFSALTTPKVLFFSGDSIGAGSGDGAFTAGGGGFMQRAVYNGGTNPLASINTCKASASGAGANNATNDVVFKWADYATIGVDENGTNDFTSTGTAVTPAQMTTITQTASTKMAGYGILKKIRTKLGMITSSTDTWATDVNQTVTGSWGSGGNIKTFNDSLSALVPTYYDSVVNMDAWRSATDQYKWASVGSGQILSTVDGIHPLTATHALLGTELRTAIDAITFSAAVVVTSGAKPMSVTWNPTGEDSAQLDKNRTFLISGNLTLVAADSGKAYVVKGGTSIFTLPATAPGLVYTFQWQGNNGGGQIQVSPVAADGIGAAGSAVVNKDLILASATIKKGDFVTIASGVGSTGVTAWHVTVQRGIVTKEA